MMDTCTLQVLPQSGALFRCNAEDRLKWLLCPSAHQPWAFRSARLDMAIEERQQPADPRTIGGTSRGLLLVHHSITCHFPMSLMSFVCCLFVLTCWLFYVALKTVILQLGSRRYPISETVVVRPRFEPRTTCFSITSQELNHYTNTAPSNELFATFYTGDTISAAVSYVRNFWED